MEENQCYAILKPPPHKSWIMSLHSAHGATMVKIGKHFYIHSLVMDGFINKLQISRSQINASLSSESYGICGSDMTTHEEESDQQHAEDVARSFNIFDPEYQPDFIADGTQASTSEAAPPVSVAAPQEPSAAERELHNVTHIPFRSWCVICVRSKARGTYHKGSLKSKSIIQMDCTFLKHSGEPGQRTRLITVLTMVETVTGMSKAVIVEHKGVTPYALGE
eukprot:160322-Amphidinium_carterae.1